MRTGSRGLLESRGLRSSGRDGATAVAGAGLLVVATAKTHGADVQLYAPAPCAGPGILAMRMYSVSSVPSVHPCFRHLTIRYGAA